MYTTVLVGGVGGGVYSFSVYSMVLVYGSCTCSFTCSCTGSCTYCVLVLVLVSTCSCNCSCTRPCTCSCACPWVCCCTFSCTCFCTCSCTCSYTLFLNLFSQTPVEEVMGVLWMVFQPLLFGLIGAKVDLSKLEPQAVGGSFRHRAEQLSLSSLLKSIHFLTMQVLMRLWGGCNDRMSSS